MTDTPKFDKYRGIEISGYEAATLWLDLWIDGDVHDDGIKQEALSIRNRLGRVWRIRRRAELLSG